MGPIGVPKQLELNEERYDGGSSLGGSSQWKNQRKNNGKIQRKTMEKSKEKQWKNQRKTNRKIKGKTIEKSKENQ